MPDRAVIGWSIPNRVTRSNPFAKPANPAGKFPTVTGQ